MHTQRLGRLEIDQAKLQQELAQIDHFPFSEAYSNYVCGGPWKSCMLWSQSGDAGDGQITNYDYDKPAGMTRYGEQLPYLMEIVERSFDLDHLNFARLAVISNSVIIPHKDLLELGKVPHRSRNAHRFHVPLITNEHCYFSEGELVYRMKFGEVWSFDASRMHSAASFSDESRVHLLLDFADVEDATKLVKFKTGGEAGIPRESICPRPAMSGEEREALLALADVIDIDNYRDVFSIVIKKHYRKDGGADFVWEWMSRIAAASPNPAVAARIEEMHRYFLVERAPEPVSPAKSRREAPVQTEQTKRAMSADSFIMRLHQHPLRSQLIHHEIFRRVRVDPISEEQAAIFVGQWWHPLHYFPTFLARCVAAVPNIAAKSAITKILSQETGQGDPKRAHEVIYIDTMNKAGFSFAQTAETSPFPETEALVAGYQRAPQSTWGALGFIFATEVADLVMVSGIGTAVERATGARELDWVKIHVEQEPDHVEEADHALLHAVERDKQGLVMEWAEEMWRLWIGFFDRLENEIFTPLPLEAGAPAVAATAR